MWLTYLNSVQQRVERQGRLSGVGIPQEPLMFPGYGNPHDRPIAAFQEAECDAAPLSLASAYRISSSALFGGGI